MKAESYALVNGQVRKNVVSRLMDLPVDGTVQVTFTGVGTKSARQRGLQHIWYNDIVASGIGDHYDSDKELLDLKCKYKFGLPILIRDDDMMAELYLAYAKKFKQDSERMMWFVKTHVHTEQFSMSQMAEFLTRIQEEYVQLGVNLTDPDARGWGNLLDYVEETA